MQFEAELQSVELELVLSFSGICSVTRLLILDNLKTGIVKNTKYETIINRSYQELAEYYGTAIVPWRVDVRRIKVLLREA